ncbi:MAG: sulfite exporter TauE/SafE family protein [Planctomycetota bacterium]
MDTIVLSAVGVVVGLAGGMFGIGGGIVLIPALTEIFGPDQHRYQAAAMIVNFCVAIPAVVQHRRARAIDAPTVARLIPAALLAILLGVGVSELQVFSGEGQRFLQLLFACFLMYCGISEGGWLLRGEAARGSPDLPSPNAPVAPPSLERTLAVAGPTGFIAGFLGVGGGIVAVPLQRKFLAIPLRRAIANSAAMIIATAFVGAIAKNYAYAADHDGSLAPVALALSVVPTAVLGSLVGSDLTHRLRLRILHLLFIMLLLVSAVRLGQGALRSPKEDGRAAAVAR